MNTFITVKELQQLMAAGSVTLVDVLLPEDFACRHISGAESACVYEMVFMDRIFELVPDRARAVVLYDYSGSTLAARTAQEKLERAGYCSVAILEGGLLAWQAAGLEVESLHSDPPAPEIFDGDYIIDRERSVVEWTGRNINNGHHGRIAVSRGDVVLENGLPVSGFFELDMNSLTNSDLEDEGWRNMLLRHLKSEDFFDVAHFPVVTFELSGATAVDGFTAGTPNAAITGTLKIKDKCLPISFPAIVSAQEDGSIKAQATLSFDRTRWGVCYGSGKLFERLGMHLVNDIVSVDLFIVARVPGVAAC